MGAKRSIKKSNTRTNVDATVNLYERSSRWVITMCNPEENWQQTISNNKELVQNTNFFIGEIEYAPSTGMRHLQAYIRFKSKQYRNKVKKWFPNSYIEIAKGSELSNIKYCSKTKKELFQIGDPYTICVQNLDKEEKVKEMLEDLLKLDFEEFEAKWPYQAFHNYGKLMEYKLRHQINVKIWDGLLKEKNVWIWGPAGTGKSRWARQQAKDLNQIYKKNLNKWWDGFRIKEHCVVIMDEMNPNKSVLVDQLKDWGDRYPFTAEVKGSSIQIDPGTYILIITSNYSIEQCFANQEDQEAIKRRFREAYVENANSLFLQTKINLEILNK